MEKETTQLNLVVKMALSAWESQNKYLTKLIDSLSDEQLMKEIAPGRNTGIYLLGHLIAVSDALFPLLDFSDRLYPELDEVFIKNPDKSGLPMPAIADLKEKLEAVNAKLETVFQTTSVDEWLERHTAVSAEDFANEPHRNKLNVLLNRTGHMANHIGQMLLLK
ncbi:DinB family protein [Lacibacter sp. H407]|uniref:DinB family protein n=1 Tax=Lacibacter sp. H407 TaxID=3133423 RepID=UPI0030BE8D57